MRSWSHAALAALVAFLTTGCAAQASASLPAWQPVSLRMVCDRLADWTPASATDVGANAHFATNLLQVAPRVDAADRAVVEQYAAAQQAYAQALANEPDVFAVRVRALARAKEDMASACRAAGRRP